MARRSQVEGNQKSILVVCTGNICRSPLAEGLLRLRLADIIGLEIASAGIHAVVGAPMHHQAARQLEALGGNANGFIAEQLTAPHVVAPDLILAMTRAQRDHMAQLYPRSSPRLFTLTEFNKVTKNCRGPNTLDDLVTYASHNRGLVRLRAEDDIPDPINKPIEVHQRVAAMILEQINGIADTIKQRQ